MSERQTILVVDDSQNDLILMREAFKNTKFNSLQEIHNGQEMIAFLEGAGSYSDRKAFPLPTVVLLDLNMPKKNGFEVLAWVRAHPEFKRLAVIILTASTRDEDVERAYDLGATGYLVKPSNLNTLTTMMRCLCDWIQINHFPRINESERKSGNSTSFKSAAPMRGQA